MIAVEKALKVKILVSVSKQQFKVGRIQAFVTISVEHLKSRGIPVKHMAFPARESNIGKVINAYLTNKEEVTDQGIHLLFSANRWEFKNEMKKLLESGTTLVVDRFCYSGVAYSVAKGLDFNWCWSPEKGLIRPDAVFYLKTSVDVLSERGDFGEER